MKEWKLPKPTKKQRERAEKLGAKIQQEYRDAVKDGKYVTEDYRWDRGL